MIGLIFLAVIAVYCFVSWVIITAAGRYASAHGKSAARWGWGAALIMYLIPFWDHLPTVVVHQFSCMTSGGYHEYKKFDQWKTENPGVLETLSRAHLPDDLAPDQWANTESRTYTGGVYFLNDGGILRPDYGRNNVLRHVSYEGPDGTKGVQLNERFRYLRKHEGPLLFNRWRNETVLYDTKTNEAVAQVIDFRTRTRRPFHIGGEDSWKVWLNNDGCSRALFKDNAFGKYQKNIDPECSRSKRDGDLRYGDGFAIECRR